MATETQVRKNIRCCKCHRIFTLLIETAGEPELAIACPFCGTRLHINLARYPKTEIEVMRGVEGDGLKTMTVFVLPEVLETAERVV